MTSATSILQIKTDKTFYIFNPFNWKVWLYVIGSCVLFTFAYCFVEWKASDTEGTPSAVAFWYCVTEMLFAKWEYKILFAHFYLELLEPLCFASLKHVFHWLFPGGKGSPRNVITQIMASMLMLYLLVIFAIYSGNLIAGMAGNFVH